MINQVFNLTEEQIDWLKGKAQEAGQSTASAVLRRVLREAMEREGAVPSAFRPVPAVEPGRHTAL